MRKIVGCFMEIISRDQVARSVDLGACADEPATLLSVTEKNIPQVHYSHYDHATCARYVCRGGAFPLAADSDLNDEIDFERGPKWKIRGDQGAAGVKAALA